MATTRESNAAPETRVEQPVGTIAGADRPTPGMPYAADFAIAPLIEPRPEEGPHDRTMVLNMGPQHPSTHGVLRLVLEIDGETVLRVVPDIGFLHTGIEKTCEAKFYQQVVPMTDRIDYLSPMSNNLCYVLAVEKLLQLEIPERAQYLRVLLNELTRIQSHLVWLGTHAMDIGALTVFLYCFREREELLKIFEHVSGQRMMGSYFRIGGVSLEPPVDFYERVQGFLTMMPSKIDEYENLLTGNPIWINRTQGVGHLSAEDAIALGVTGPPLRASGVDWDLRRDMPYSGYERFSFRVPVSNDGDVWARYVVRMEEMRESLKICQQALDGMPGGPLRADAPKVVLPDREAMKTQMEALIYHFKIVTEGFAVPPGEVFQAIESPRGEMGYYVVSDGTSKPYRVHMRNPSYATLQAVDRMCAGRLLADVVAVIGSIDIVLGEIDR
jgi:NADH-quinone oxidoreductase subunit D